MIVCVNRKPYPGGLTSKQWDVPAPMLPAAKPGGRPRSVDLLEVINGILYVLRACFVICGHDRLNVPLITPKT